VTDQGSPALPPHDVLPHKPNEPNTQPKKGNPHCHFCGAPVTYLRHGFLRYDVDENFLQKSACWPLEP
jgi:hypothetical protein